MLLAHDGSRAREMRCGHRRALEEREARRCSAEGGWNRAQDVDTGRNDVGLDTEIDVGRSLAAESGHDVDVRRQEVRQRRADRRR